MDVPTNGSAQEKLFGTTADDQRFLLNFITGNYLGPDVVTDIPRRSILQRVVEGLPLYKHTDLGSSFLTLQQLESLYEYILQDAHPSAVTKAPSLHQYFNNKLPLPKFGLPEDMRQFHFFFPPEQHIQESRGRKSKTFKGLVIINDPDTSHIQPDALAKFKLLTGRNDVKINMEELETHCNAKQDEKKEKNMKRRQESAKNGLPQKRARLIKPLQALPLIESPLAICYPGYPDGTKTLDVNVDDGPSMLMLITSKVDWNSKYKLQPSIVYSGTAKERVGLPMGQVDIGTSSDAYFFRAVLPGVDTKRFICEVEHCGRINIKGFTVSGQRFVHRGPRVFCMKTQNLPPCGEFTVSFKLPGNVDNRSFYGDFRGGLFEAVVNKQALVHNCNLSMINRWLIAQINHSFI